MGYGDKLMAIGDAWAQYRADPKRRRVAIGDGQSIDAADRDLTWGLDRFLTNDAALAGGEDVSWVHSYAGHRPYVDYDELRRQAGARGLVIQKSSKLVARLGHYVWKGDYRPTPAPIRLTPREEALVAEWRAKGPFVIVEPFIKAKAPPSKQWSTARFVTAAVQLRRDLPVFQIAAPGRPPLSGLPQIKPTSFREALAYLKAASLYLGPEGGLHHAAAAVGTRAVVIYGGFISPAVTGYPDLHVNLTGNDAGYACGTRYNLCPHCVTALDSISVAQVVREARKLLEAGNA